MLHTTLKGPVTLWLAAVALGPVCAQSTFYARYFPAVANAGQITPSLNNAFYGVTVNSNLDHLYFYKLDQSGDVLWMNEALTVLPSLPVGLTALSDSSFAFLAVQFGADAKVLFKISDTGDVLWTRTLTIGSSASFSGIAPTTDGGIMLTGSGCLGAQMILHIDTDGHIVSQHGHASWDSQYYRPNAIGMVHDGDDQYSYTGYAHSGGGAYVPLTFFRSDSAGIVYSYREIHDPSGSAHSWPVSEDCIVRSPSGGHFIAAGVQDDAGVNHHIVLFYLNAQDEMMWFKKIETTDVLLNISGLSPTADGGCVLIGSNTISNTPFLYAGFALKFNGVGDLIWSTMVGDNDLPDWDNTYLSSIVPASDGHFMTAPVRGGFDLCRVDADFDGFCETMPFTPVVTGMTPTVIPYTVSPTAINFVEGDIDITPDEFSYARTTVCSFNAIDETEHDTYLTIAPNPASDQFRLGVKIDRPQRVEVSVQDALGAVCYYRRYDAQPDQPLVIQTSDLPTGAYVVEVRSQFARQRARLVVQH